jgi:thiamine biosynthesis lipoprotein
LASADLKRFDFEKPEMGVRFQISLYSTNEAQAELAATAAFKRIEQLNAVLSDYETDSEISRLSQSSEEGSPEVHLGDDLWNVLDRSQALARETHGAFDVTVGPCVALWRKARREKQLPNAARLENARAKVGYTNLVLNPRTHGARLLRYGMRLDVGGIAKGYAADEARAVLRDFGITRALVAASGDLSLGDPPPDAKGWRVELTGYDDPHAPAAARALTVTLANCGISSSGDLFQRLEINGVRYSHILDPFTCIGLTNHALSVVIAKNGKMADSLDTVMTLVEPAEALRIAARHGAAARIVRLETEKTAVYENKKFRKIAERTAGGQ